MRAVIYDPQARASLGWADVDEPSRVADGGSAQSVGMASNQPTTIDFEAERLTGTRKSLEPFTVRALFGPDLGYLVELLAAGALLGRRIAGKAVLDVH